MDCTSAIPEDMASTQTPTSEGRPSEKEMLETDIKANKCILRFEDTPNIRSECQAEKCLVAELDKMLARRIHSFWRLCMDDDVPGQEQQQTPTEPRRRYYHVICFEALGIDIWRYLVLPDELDQKMFKRRTIPPAVQDWVGRGGGKCFRSKDYVGYAKVLEAWKEYMVKSHMGKKANKRSSIPERPSSHEFIIGEPIERSLSDVLIDELGGGPLLPLERVRDKIGCLELGLGPHSIGVVVQHQLRIRAAKQAEEAAQDDGT